MNRDSFWESAVDILKMAAKIVIVMVALQIMIIVSGSEMKIPYVYSIIMKVLFWIKETFSGVKFGV